MEVRRDPRSFVFIILLLFLLNSPEPAAVQIDSRSRYDAVIEREWNELGILNNTGYGDFDAGSNKWLNITGLRDVDRFAWDLLGPVQQRAIEQTKGLLGDTAEAFLDGSADDTLALPLYRNISGYVQGEWVRSPLGRVRHPSDLNMSALFEQTQLPEHDRNLTGTGGTVRLHFTELEGRTQTDENRTVSEITARIIIGDKDSVGDNWWEFILNGVHFPRLGTSVLTTTSAT